MNRATGLSDVGMPAQRSSAITLRIAPLIDVVFLLLIFFLLSVSFQPPEDHLPVLLPTAPADHVSIVEPLTVYVASMQDGQSRLQIGAAEVTVISSQQRVEEYAVWGQHLSEILSAQGRYASDPIRLAVDEQTRWDHLVRAYQTLWRLGLTHIIFT